MREMRMEEKAVVEKELGLEEIRSPEEI